MIWIFLTVLRDLNNWKCYGNRLPKSQAIKWLSSKLSALQHVTQDGQLHNVSVVSHHLARSQGNQAQSSGNCHHCQMGLEHLRVAHTTREAAVAKGLNGFNWRKKGTAQLVTLCFLPYVSPGTTWGPQSVPSSSSYWTICLTVEWRQYSLCTP